MPLVACSATCRLLPQRHLLLAASAPPVVCCLSATCLLLPQRHLSLAASAPLVACYLSAICRLLPQRHLSLATSAPYVACCLSATCRLLLQWLLLPQWILLPQWRLLNLRHLSLGLPMLPHAGMFSCMSMLPVRPHAGYAATHVRAVGRTCASARAPGTQSMLSVIMVTINLQQLISQWHWMRAPIPGMALCSAV